MAMRNCVSDRFFKQPKSNENELLSPTYLEQRVSFYDPFGKRPYENPSSLSPPSQKQQQQQQQHQHHHESHLHSNIYHYTARNFYSGNKFSAAYKIASEMICASHNFPITNYCSSLSCLTPLCPECIDQHNNFHFKQRTLPQIESIKIMISNCTKKVETAISSLQNEMMTTADRHLIDSESLAAKGVSQIRLLREKLVSIVNRYFENQENEYRDRVSRNQLHQGDFQPTFSRMNALVRELTTMKEQLNESDSILHSFNRICRLDLLSLRDKFKSEIAKIVASKDLDPLAISIDPSRIEAFKQELSQILLIDSKTTSTADQANNQFSNYLKLKQQQHRNLFPIEEKSPFRSSSNDSNSKVKDIQIRIEDFFSQQIQEKNLHYFQPEAKSLTLVTLETNEKQEIKLTGDTQNFPTYYRSVTTQDGSIYLISGTRQSEQNAVFKFGLKQEEGGNNTATEGQLVEVQNSGMKVPRSAFSLVLLRNCIYVLGGIDSASGKPTLSCEKFNLKTHVWEHVGDLVAPIVNAGCCTFNSQFIFAIGGTNMSRNKNNNYQEDDDAVAAADSNFIQKYDIIWDTWSVVSFHLEVPVSFTTNCACVQINLKEILVLGGSDVKGKATSMSFVIQVRDSRENAASEGVASNDDGKASFVVISKVNSNSLPSPCLFSKAQVILQDNQLHVLQEISLQAAVAAPAGPSASNLVQKKKKTMIVAHLHFDGSYWNSKNLQEI